MSKADKIIFWVLGKIEFRLSKKENKILKRDNVSDRLRMYRDILDIIDTYRMKINPELSIFRHYRNMLFKIEEE